MNTTPEFPPVEKWPELWIKGRDQCKDMEEGFNPAKTFEDNFVPDETLKEWLRTGFACNVWSAEAPSKQQQRAACITCQIMCLDTEGNPCWRQYSGPWLPVKSDDEIIAMKNSFASQQPGEPTEK